VSPGPYFIQVGGYYDPGLSPVAARNGPIAVQVDFTEDLDVDDDGVSRLSGDCNDRDPAIRPGRIDIPENHIDEDCLNGDSLFPPVDVTIGGTTETKRGRTHWITLFVKNVPAGATIRVTCTGGGCPKRSGQIRVKRKHGSVSALAAMRRTLRLLPKAQLEVRVSKTHFTTRLRRWRMVARHPPTSIIHCLWSDGRRRC
jgi:hypothetical protein